MKRLTAFLFLFLFALAGFSQRVLTHEGKILTHAGKVLYNHVPPDQVPGLKFWLDGKDPSTVSLNVNNVIQWDDKSGHDRHVSNAVDAQRPTYSAATGRLTFTAANSTYLQSAVFASALEQPNTIFMVHKVTNANVYVFDGISTVCILAAFSKFYINASTVLYGSLRNIDDNIHILEFNGTSSSYWMNGILVGGPANAGANSLDGITLGSSRVISSPADCEIMEVFGYNRILSDTERNQLTNYLKDKWELTY